MNYLFVTNNNKALITMFPVDLLFGQPLYKKLRKKYNELVERM